MSAVAHSVSKRRLYLGPELEIALLVEFDDGFLQLILPQASFFLLILLHAALSTRSVIARRSAVLFVAPQSSKDVPLLLLILALQRFECRQSDERNHDCEEDDSSRREEDGHSLRCRGRRCGGAEADREKGLNGKIEAVDEGEFALVSAEVKVSLTRPVKRLGAERRAPTRVLT